MKKINAIFIYTNSVIASIDKSTGDIIWSKNIKEYKFKSVTSFIAELRVEDTEIFLAVSGQIACINAKDGSLIWFNNLKGWGYYPIIMAQKFDEKTNTTNHIQAMAAAAAIAAGSA